MIPLSKIRFLKLTKIPTTDHWRCAFQKGAYASAIPYLAKYNSRSATSIEMDYQLGYAYFKTGAYQKCIPLLDKATKRKDELAQKAYYHIGESYLRLEKYAVARSAFEQAYLAEIDNKITEDALYQFAVLSYKLDLNPYNEAVVALEKYLNEYPNSTRKDDVYQYLVNVYATTNNYVKALESLDRLPEKDYKLKSIYQLIAFNAGVEQFLKSNYNGAQSYFNMVGKYPVDPRLTSKAKYWNGDADFQKKSYAAAILKFRQFLSLPGGTKNLKADAYYNIGYAYLQIRDTIQAIDNLKLYTQQGPSDSHKLADAWMRIADGYYATRQNQEAIKAYQEVLTIRSGYEDQALYYLGKTHGYAGETQNRIVALEEILSKHPASQYVQMSILEIALSYKLREQYDKALSYYTRYTNEYPTAGNIIEAELQIADIYFKKNDLTMSESLYTDILNKNAGLDRRFCIEGGKGLLAIYIQQKKPEKISSMKAKYPCTEVDSNEEEDVFYSTAIEVYNDSNYRDAIPQLEKYLDKYPNGKYSTEFTYFMANCFENLDDSPQAIVLYRELLERPTNGYTEFAAIRVSKYLYNNGQNEDAYSYYKQLEKISSNPEVLMNARIGIMRTSFILSNWTEANIYASKLLNGYELDSKIALEANYSKGMANYNLNSYEAALGSLIWLADNTTTKMGSEAKYYSAEIYFKQEDYESTEATIREIMKRKPAHNYWVAKALILKAKLGMLTDDLFQAEQTLKSIIEHYPEKEDGILMSANQLWDELMQIKNQPKEVEDEEQPIIDINNDGK